MKLLINYTLYLYDELTEQESFQHKFCAVECPDNLLQSQFFEFVKDNKYDSIFLMEKDCVGSLEIKGMIINSVEYLTVL